MFPLSVIDQLVSDSSTGRWLFFGQDHGPLLVGAIVATALLAICVRIAGVAVSTGRVARLCWSYGLVGALTAFLVWVAARGWLVAAIFGLATLAVSALWQPTLRVKYARLLFFVIVVVMVSLVTLPRTMSQHYMALLETSAPTLGATQRAVPGHPAVSTPQAGLVLGTKSCVAFKQATSSVAIRWMLYGEAMEMAGKYPLMGVGAARFGDHSCSGVRGYPHSTLLQAMSELGLAGGVVLLALICMALLVLARAFLHTANQIRPNSVAAPFALSVSVAFFVADQLYGNYFMSTATYLMLGLVAGILAEQKRTRLDPGQIVLQDNGHFDALKTDDRERSAGVGIHR